MSETIFVDMNRAPAGWQEEIKKYMDGHSGSEPQPIADQVKLTGCKNVRSLPTWLRRA